MKKEDGQIAYEAYIVSCPVSKFTGDKLPEWKDVDKDIKRHWKFAEQQVRKHFTFSTE